MATTVCTALPGDPISWQGCVQGSYLPFPSPPGQQGVAGRLVATGVVVKCWWVEGQYLFLEGRCPNTHPCGYAPGSPSPGGVWEPYANNCFGFNCFCDSSKDVFL